MDYFAHTTTGMSGSSFQSFDPSLYSEGLTATWLKQSGDSYGSYAVTVLVAGNWYASLANVGGVANPVFDFLTASWVTVSDSPSAPLARGTTSVTSATLFSGETIDGFGYFVTNLGTRILRIDNIVIEGVPEPSTALLGLCGTALLLRRRQILR